MWRCRNASFSLFLDHTEQTLYYFSSTTKKNYNNNKALQTYIFSLYSRRIVSVHTLRNSIKVIHKTLRYTELSAHLSVQQYT